MAIASIKLQKPKVVEELDSDTDSDTSRAESEEPEIEARDMKIKQELEEDFADLEKDNGKETFNVSDYSFVAVKKEEEESDGFSSAGEEVKAKKDATEIENNDSDSNSDSLGEGPEEDDFGDVESEGEGQQHTTSGLANVMAKILGTKKSEDVILSKAKKDGKAKKKDTDDGDTFEIVDSSGNVKKEPKIKEEKEEEEEEEHQLSVHKRALQKKVWEERFHVKPNISEDREKERRLRVLATQGVVQLFSAIEKHKNMMQKKLSETRSVMGREKVLETTGKEAFLEILKQQGKKVKQEDVAVKQEDVKEEIKEEPVDLPLPPKKKPKWNVFADNFYKEPTLQGWDQQSEEEED